jgi:hypothetical protein
VWIANGIATPDPLHAMKPLASDRFCFAGGASRRNRLLAVLVGFFPFSIKEKKCKTNFLKCLRTRRLEKVRAHEEHSRTACFLILRRSAADRCRGPLGAPLAPGPGLSISSSRSSTASRDSDGDSKPYLAAGRATSSN